jgi:hypothetical protein
VRALNAREAACRNALGELAHELCHRRTYHRLGYARLGDYTRERLGLSPREVENLAQVSVALRHLPATAAMFARGDLSWTHTRLITAVATAETEPAWLERARRCSGAELATIVRSTTAESVGDGARILHAALDDASDLADGEVPVRFRLRCPPRLRALFYDTIELARRMAGAALPMAHAVEAIAAEAFSGAPRGFADLPSRSDARPSDDPLRPQPALSGTLARAVASDDAPRATSSPSVDSQHAADARCVTAPPRGAPDSQATCHTSGELDSARPSHMRAVGGFASSAAALSPRELDMRLRETVAALRSIDWRMGRLLEVVRRRRLHRLLGFRGLGDYLRDRVGIAPRTARALMAAERAVSCHAALRRAYRAGDLSWLQVLTLTPAVAHAPESIVTAWIARARRVTLRRLTDEVTWAADRRDSGAHGPAAPPPLDARLDDEWQIGAHADTEPQGDESSPDEQRTAERQIGTSRTPEIADPPLELISAEITFIGPASVVALFRTAIAAFAQTRVAAPAPSPTTAALTSAPTPPIPTPARTAAASPAPAPEPAWRSCERMLRHVRATWLSQPRHRDPVFERDGWRCTVPACSGRRHLHDHHLRFRSRGGDNRRTNRTSVCASHHLHGIHAGSVRAWGTAPADIRWQLGIENHSSWALLDFLGDRYLEHDEVLADRAAHNREMAARLATWIPLDGNWESTERRNAGSL